MLTSSLKLPPIAEIGYSSKKNLYLLGGIVSLLIIGAVVASVFEYLIASIFAIIGAILFLKDSRIRFALTITLIFVLQIEPPETEITILGYIAGVIFGGGILLEILKKKIISHTPLTNSKFFTYFSFFLFWNVGLGIIGILSGEYTFLAWLKESLLWAPLFLIPIYSLEIVKKYQNHESFFSIVILCLWLAVTLATVLKIKSNLTQAVYLFEIGVARYDTTNGAFMMLIFLSLGMILHKKWWTLLTIGFFISFISLLLTFGRTAWVAGVGFLPFILLLGNRIERKQGYKFTVTLIFFGALGFILLYFSIPIVRVGTGFIFGKLFSSTHLKTDPSMYNRYIEWARILKAIYNLPISGYGFGATFYNYDWLLGISRFSAYTHNAYLSVIFKSGIVGFILLMTAYIGFFVRGLSLMKEKLITGRERAYLRAGCVVILYTTVIGYTGNVFYQREMMLYIAIFWSFCVCIQERVNIRKEIVHA